MIDTATENPKVITSGESQEEASDVYEDPLKGLEDLQKALMDILHNFDLVEEPTRNYGLRLWKKCENYWHHIQNIYWSTSNNSWSTPNDFMQQYPDSGLSDAEMKIINIYRAHGESIVAALSVGTPSIRYFPEDADNPSDVNTSKAYSKIAKIIERQNKAKLLLMRMIYILYNQGMVAVHNYSHESKEYGVTKKPIYDTKKAHYATSRCSECAEPLSEHGPSFDGPIKLQNDTNALQQCPTCEARMIPSVDNEERDEKYIKDYETSAKCRQKIASYGPLNIKISSYAYDQKSVGILVFDSEQNMAKAQEMYPDIAASIRTGPLSDDPSVQARTPNTVVDSYSKGNVTVRQFWVRPWQFNSYTKQGNPQDDAIVKKLKEIFPDGCCVHAVNDTYAESYKESLDKAWSLSFNPCDRFIQSDPVGLALIPVQDMKNMVVNLSVESLEYGVPELFVDPEVLDFEGYKQARGGPGMIFPIKPTIPGSDISKSFFNNKQATLTDEAGRLESRIDAAGQFVSGDYPSIYGGPNFGDTAAEYSMSRQQALQRLSTTWTIVSFLWADVMKNSAEGYIANLKEDEHYVEANGDDYVNIWIRMNEVDGNVGDVYPESSEQFPVSWAQQREILMQLIQMQNPMIEAVISDPNNRSQVASILGLSNITMPGDQDRMKQLNEISLLIKGEPDPTGAPSVMPEEKVDDHMMHISTCKHWLNSEVGQYFKMYKPSQYMNVMLHMEIHEQMMQATMMPPQPQQDQGQGQQQ